MAVQPAVELGSLKEIHFGEVRVSAGDIASILTSLPQLTVLRHYQLTTAFCLLHGKEWEKTRIDLPKYNLTNIDADFSHVVIIKKIYYYYFFNLHSTSVCLIFLSFYQSRTCTKMLQPS